MSNAKHIIAVEPRAEFGNNASRRLRKASRVPAVLYSKGVEPRALSVDADEWKVVSSHGSHMVTLVEAGKEIPALVREVQFNHLKNYVVHIDFQQVDLSQEITDAVPLHAFGEPAGAVRGGVLEQEIHEISITCRPDLLPEFVQADVSALEIGDVMTVADIKLPEGIKAAMDPEQVVFSVVPPMQEEPEPEAAEEDAAAEPEAINEKKTAERAAEKENAKK